MATKNSELVTITDEKQIESVKKAIGGDRASFPTLEAAAPIIESVSTLAGKLGLTVAIAGLNDEGEIDDSIYADCHTIVATLGARVQVKEADGTKTRVAVKGIVVYPQPKVESFLDSDAGRDFIAKVVEKEVALVAFRRFRDSATVDEFVNNVQSVPLDALTYATESGRSSIDTDAFDKLWPGLRAMLKSDNPALYAALPAKDEFYKAIRSKSYAETNPNTAPFEERGFIVKMAEIIIGAAASNRNPETGEAEPLDASPIESWIAAREEVNLTWSAPKPKNFDILDSVSL